MIARIRSAAAAEYLGITQQELKALRRWKRIPFYRIGHRTVSYNVADLEAFLDSCRVPARDPKPGAMCLSA